MIMIIARLFTHHHWILSSPSLLFSSFVNNHILEYSLNSALWWTFDQTSRRSNCTMHILWKCFATCYFATNTYLPDTVSNCCNTFCQPMTMWNCIPTLKHQLLKCDFTLSCRTFLIEMHFARISPSCTLTSKESSKADTGNLDPNYEREINIKGI